MSGRFPILRSLDPYHQRIGYLGAVSLVAVRALDTLETLRKRLDELLLMKIYDDSPAFNAMLRCVSQERANDLERLRRNRKAEDNPAAILQKTGESSHWHFTSEFWLHQDCMPSPIGLVGREKLDRLINLARWTGLISPLFELTEPGFLLQLMLQASPRYGTDDFNPLCVDHSPALRLFYLRQLLRSEVLWPYLVIELVDRADAGRVLATSGEGGLLGAAVERLLEHIGPLADLSDALDLREITTFRDAIAKTPSTAENYLRPRLEILVDLNLIGRATSGGRNEFVWIPTLRTRHLAEEWRRLSLKDDGLGKHLECGFFGTMGRVYEETTRPVTDPRRVLLWFARAYRSVGREVGFTPGRTVALMACLLAFNKGDILEVSQVFDVIYGAARSQWHEFLRFSGGSRMDREFTIKVGPGLEKELEDDLRNRPEIS
jgi:hypothetical protein